MKALVLTAHGDTSGLELRELPTPKPVRGEALVKVEASGVNHMDVLVRRGYPGIPVTLPHVLGGDVVGTVVDAFPSPPGERARERGITVGQRVVAAPVSGCGDCEVCREGRRFLCAKWQYLGFHRPGGYAEYVCVPAEDLVPLPAHVDAAAAAALPVAGLTAFHALATVGALRSGQSLFLWGATGALGSMAVQVAKALGVRTVVTASTDAKRVLAKQLGADLVLDPKDAALVEQVRAFSPGGVDAVFDFIGAETFPKSFELAKKGGQLLLCGMIGGREAPLSIHQTYLRHLSIKGLYLGSRDELARLVDLVAKGAVTPHVGARLPLADAAEGQRRLERREGEGKLALVL